MLVELSKADVHRAEVLGRDTVKLCEMQGFKPRLENDAQDRVEANQWGFKAEFAVARLFNLDPPDLTVVTDGGVDLWMGDLSIDVKFTNKTFGPLVFDSMEKFKADIAVLVGRGGTDNELSVNGFVLRKVFEDSAVEHDFGYGKRLVMKADDMKPIERLWLIQVMDKHGRKNEREESTEGS